MQHIALVLGNCEVKKKKKKSVLEWSSKNEE